MLNVRNLIFDILNLQLYIFDVLLSCYLLKLGHLFSNLSFDVLNLQLNIFGFFICYYLLKFDHLFSHLSLDVLNLQLYIFGVDILLSYYLLKFSNLFSHLSFDTFNFPHHYWKFNKKYKAENSNNYHADELTIVELRSCSIILTIGWMFLSCNFVQWRTLIIRLKCWI